MNILTVHAQTLPRVAARARTSTHPGVLERGFAAVVLFLSAGGLLPLFRLEGGVAVDELEGDPVLQITWMVIYGIALVLLAVRAKAALQLVGRERWLILLCSLAAMSVVWSVAPGITLRRTAALFGTTAFGVYLASRYTVAELLRLVCWVLGTAAVLSVAVVFFAPAYGIGIDETGWRGIFEHKNTLGRTMALAALVLVFQLRRRGLVNRLATVTILALVCVALFGSRSVGGLLTALAVLITMPLWLIFRLRRILMVAVAMFVLITLGGVAIWLSTASEAIVTAVGRDPSFTGRTALWLQVLDAIAPRVWLGHGYSAYWLGWEGESATIWRAITWRPPHAHNGFLDLGLELGVAGIALFIVGLVRAAWRATVLVGRTETGYGLWPIAYLLFIVTANLAESAIMVRNSMTWMLYVVVCMWLVRLHGDSKRAMAA